MQKRKGKMDEIRKLVYEDRTLLNDFGINDTGSLNNLIYDEWLLGRQEIDPFETNHLAYWCPVKSTGGAKDHRRGCAPLAPDRSGFAA